MLQGVGFVVHLIPAIAHHLNEKNLQQPVATDELKCGQSPLLGKGDTVGVGTLD